VLPRTLERLSKGNRRSDQQVLSPLSPARLLAIMEQKGFEP
jgi:hypothetical protein